MDPRFSPARSRDEVRASRCPNCKSDALTDGTSEFSRSFGDITFRADLPAQVCSNCGESLVWGPDLGAFDRRVTRELVHRGADHPRALRWLRPAVMARQGPDDPGPVVLASDLADLLGVNSETVVAWESGEQPIGRAHLAVLGQLVLEALDGRTTTVDRLRALASRPSPAVVSLNEATPMSTSRRDAA